MKICPVCNDGYLNLIRRVQVVVKGSNFIHKINIYNCSNPDCQLNSREGDRIRYSDFICIDEMNFEVEKKDDQTNGSEN